LSLGQADGAKFPGFGRLAIGAADAGLAVPLTVNRNFNSFAIDMPTTICFFHPQTLYPSFDFDTPEGCNTVTQTAGTSFLRLIHTGSALSASDALKEGDSDIISYAIVHGIFHAGLDTGIPR
jgi:hypothetical protein